MMKGRNRRDDVKRERMESLKFMRVVAMLLVVLIHATGVALRELSPADSTYVLYIFLNRFTRFEGAVFVFLSGAVLFYNYMVRPFTKETWVHFYRRRFIYIIGPYIAWSIFYEGYAIYSGLRTFDTWGDFFYRVAFGQSFYQLYFILILVQFYFLMPIFVYLMQRFSFLRRHVIWIGIFIEWTTQVWLKEYMILPFTPFTVYIGSFLLGAWVGTYYEKVHTLWKRHTFIIWSFISISLGVLYSYIYVERNVKGHLDIPYAFFKLESILYFLIATYVLFKVAIWLEQKGSARLNGWADHVSLYSFGFYLLHPLVLDVWQQLIPYETIRQMHLVLFVHYVLTVLTCYFVIRIIHHRIPQLRFLFGNLPNFRTPNEFVRDKYTHLT